MWQILHKSINEEKTYFNESDYTKQELIKISDVNNLVTKKKC